MSTVLGTQNLSSPYRAINFNCRHVEVRKGAIPDTASKHATKCTEIKRRGEKSGVANGPYGLEYLARTRADKTEKFFV